MSIDTDRAQQSSGFKTPSIPAVWNLARKGIRRLGWGVADQGMSSISNFAVNIYIARTLGAVEYGAFSLAYVTYGFATNAWHGLSIEPLLIRTGSLRMPTASSSAPYKAT